MSWCASLAVVLDRCAGDLRRVRRLGLDRFTEAVRRELPRWGGIRPRLRIRAVFAALADPAGVTAHRPGAMDDLGLAGLVTTIDGLTVTGAAAILAETGDPARFTTTRALDGHAGLCPRDNSSGAAQGRTSISGRGRPGPPAPQPCCWIHVVVTRRVTWDPAIAAGGTPLRQAA